MYVCTRAPLRGRLTPPHARARQGRMQLKTYSEYILCKGGRKGRPMIWCEQRFDNAKSCLCRENCPVVLSCAVCFYYRCLIGSMGVICVGEKTGGREKSNTCRKRKSRKSSTPYTTRIIPGTALFSKESTQRSDTAPQRRARHRTARLRTAPHGATLRCWAIYSRSDLSWACMWSNSV